MCALLACLSNIFLDFFILRIKVPDVLLVLLRYVVSFTAIVSHYM